MNNERYEIAKEAIRTALQFGLGVYSTVNEQMMDYGYEWYHGNELLALIDEVESEIVYSN